MESVNAEWNVKPLQKAILDVFREFEKICERHGLRYFAIGGTALGAVRHRGFIPWDDDMDVAMPREDYNKFVGIANKELPTHLRFCRGGETRLSPIYFGKIVDIREGIVDNLRLETNLNLTVPPFLDIFVLEGLPESVTDIKKWWRGHRFLRICQIFRYPKSTLPGFARKSIRVFLSSLLCKMFGFVLSWFYPATKNNEEMMKIFDAYFMRWPFDSARVVVEPAFFRFKTSRIFPRIFFEPAKNMPFEDGEIRVPSKVEEYLSQYFGDYMRLPPPEHRIPEHTFKRAYNHA